MNVQDDLYLGSGFTLGATTSANPTLNQGVGPMGRIAFLDIVPLTASNNNIATNQHMTNGTALTLTAGTGITKGTSPTGTTIYTMDVARCVSLTSTSNLSAINFTLVALDQYGAQLTSKIAGPNNNTVSFPKSALSVISITPDTTDGTHNVSAGMTDIFGLPYVVTDAGFVIPKWANALPLDTGTLVLADATSPATVSTGDVRGTYLPSTASNGTNRLVLWLHLLASQCGYTATKAAAIGVTQV